MVEKRIVVPDRPVAIGEADLSEFGCPNCGYTAGFSFVRVTGARTWTCNECCHSCVVLSSGIEKSPIGIGIRGTSIYPELIKHPFSGGEPFEGTRLAAGSSNGCFVCGKKDASQLLSGRVVDKSAGERVVAMTGQYASFEEGAAGVEETWVKVGVCAVHTPQLARLFTLITGRGRNTITPKMIEVAASFK